MAFFQSIPDNVTLSDQARIVEGDSVVVGLAEAQGRAQELGVRADNPAVTCTRLDGMVGTTRLWRISSGGRPAVATIFAVDLANTFFDRIFLSFRGHGTGRFADVAVRSATAQVLGSEDSNHLFRLEVPAINIIDVSTFRPGDPTNKPRFTLAAGRHCRAGIFSASNSSGVRAAILLLPESGTPDSVIIGITHRFGQNRQVYEPLGWANPLSRELILFALERFVRIRWGAQVLASRKQMALLLIVRAAPGESELGPFAHDGLFTRSAFDLISLMTGRSFTVQHAEAFSYSNGIVDFNPFIGATRGHLNYRALYNVDPAHDLAAPLLDGAVRKQFTTKRQLPGFEFMPMPRWENEPRFADRGNSHDYLHNRCMPLYALHLGIQLA